MKQRKKDRSGLASVLCIGLCTMFVATATAQVQEAEYRPGEVIVKFRQQASETTIRSSVSEAGLQIVKRYGELDLFRCNIAADQTVEGTVAECRADPDIEYVEPNYIYRTFETPNDPRFSSLYGLAMIEAAKAWDLQTGAHSVLVGVIDTGVDLDHEDLAANIWTNPGESGDGKENNGIDDDGNGYVDDIHGWDFINNDNNPDDDNSHGTHVSGTLGAVGNNGVGIVGVNWGVSILPLKFLAADGSGTTDDALQAIIYAVEMGAKVLSNSWGGGGRSQALEDAIGYARDNGVLFVAAAGNDGLNIDTFPSYPAGYNLDNIIAVANNTQNETLANSSNFGKMRVHLSAPGTNILSSTPNNGYQSFTGTSMATPHVSGAAALVWAQFPSATYSQVKSRLLAGVDRRAAYTDKVASGGRLNVFKALSTNPIVSTTQLGNTPDETGPYVVTADISDDGTITSAELTYEVTGAAGTVVAMTSAGGSSYRGEIPGQQRGKTISYFVKATDDDGNTTQDQTLSFTIQEDDDGGDDDGGCGDSKGAVGVNGIQNPTLHRTVSAFANLLFFVLPIAGLAGLRRRRR